MVNVSVLKFTLLLYNLSCFNYENEMTVLFKTFIPVPPHLNEHRLDYQGNNIVCFYLTPFSNNKEKLNSQIFVGVVRSVLDVK